MSWNKPVPGSTVLEITNSEGKVVEVIKVKAGSSKANVVSENWGSGIYYLGLIVDGQPYHATKLVVK